MLATLFSFTFTLSFSLVTNLTRLVLSGKTMARSLAIASTIAGLIGGFLVACGGNLHSLYAFFVAYPNENPVPLWQLVFSPFTFPNSYWYPNATRFIYHTIHEFPIYSFIVSDLHGHVLDIPNVLLFVGLAFIYVKDYINQKLQRQHVYFLVFLGFLLSIMYMTNAWDSLIYFGFWIVLLLVFIKDDWKSMAIHLGVPLLTFFILSRPFSAFFNASELVSGIGVLCAPTFLTNIGHLGPFLFEPNHCQRSPLYQLFILWGIPFILFISFLFFMKRQKKQQNPIDIFVICLFAVGFILVLIPEFLYMKDIYPEHYRANTMFKLTYQSFMLFGMASAYTIARIAKSLKRIYVLPFLLASLILITPALIYPYLAIPGYYNFSTPPSGLYGLTYLANDYPQDYAAVIWLNHNITGQPVILEAQGDSYTNYARISANTGLPTVLGWTVHEWLWRGSYNPLPPRMQDIQTIYETTDIATAKSLMQKYNVTLIYIGGLERKKYTNLNEDKFYQMGTLIYSNQDTQIFQIQ